MSPAHQSPLLQCLSQLNDDTWAAVLLPKLIKQRSARNAAASCTQLRDLCFRTVQDVVLGSTSKADISTMGLSEWISPLPACFPNCTTLALYMDCQRDYINVPHLLPALARLPKLADLRLNVTTPAEPTAMAMLFGSMRTSLTVLRGLTWELRKPWHKAAAVWQELGFYHQLTELTLEYNMSDGAPFSFDELAPLSKLNSLQRLKLAPEKWLPDVLPAQTPETADGDWLQCLAGMTALKTLTVLVPQLAGLHHVSSCGRLVNIDIVAYQAGTALADADWEAIGQLTLLTRLMTATQSGGAAPASCYAALGNLQRLQCVAISGWTADVLPVLHVLTCLTTICGNWLPTPGGVAVRAEQSCNSCPHVRQLKVCSGPVPFAAFPNVEFVFQVGALDCSSVVALGNHCQSLQQLGMDRPVANTWPAPAGSSMTFSTVEPIAARVAAIKSLAKLQKLCSMGFKPSCNEELTAFVEVVQQLQKHKLHLVGVGLDPGCTVDGVGLMLLGRLSGLSQFDLVDSTVGSVVGASPGYFMSAMSGLAYVNVHVPQDYGPVMQTKYNELVATGLAVPHTLHVHGF